MLTLDDIVDLRAYERVREDYRRRVIAKKRLRRVSVGPILTLVFECFDTIRFQIQEMARAEKIVTDEGIQTELDIYNALLPSAGELSATLFVELTSDEELRRWLPRLVGIERAIAFELGALSVRSLPEAAHAEALTREEITAAVHYVRFAFDAAARDALAGDGPALLAARHPEYQESTVLSPETRAELVADLDGRTERLALA
jgi:hypothetical protein